MMQDDLNLIRKRLDEAQNIAIFLHIRPDGDSVGSTLALGWALEDIGKNVQFISEDEVPYHYHFLFEYTNGGSNPFCTEPGPETDCFITPDISSLDRAGKFFLARPGLRPDICIDHHVSNSGIGVLNWIEPNSPAACCVLTGILPKMGFTLTKRISSALLCGIITDTNSFSNSDVDSAALRYAADLVDNGAPIFKINRLAYKEHSPLEMEFWKIGFNNLHFENQMIWSVIRKADREAIGYQGDDDHGFVSFIGNTAGICVSVLFTEVSETETKISWRAVPGYNVADVALAFGGGGHAPASGATVSGRLEDVISAVLKKTREMLF